MGIINTLNHADLWLCTHMNYYVTESHLGRFGEFGEQYGMEYFNNILDFNCIHISKVPPEQINKTIISEIDNDNYIIVFWDYESLYKYNRRIHELMVFGYDDCGFICAIKSGDRFIEKTINYDTVERGYAQAYSFFMSNGWELLWRRSFFFGITSISPKKEYNNDNILFGFIKKLRSELKGGKLTIETREYVENVNQNKTYYSGASSLLFFASEFDAINSLKWKDNDRKCYITFLALRTAYEHHKLLLRNMRFIQNFINADDSELLNQTIDSYRIVVTNAENAYLLFYKYCLTHDSLILSRISELCSQEYTLARSLLQKFEDALWPYYYALNGVPMPADR